MRREEGDAAAEGAFVVVVVVVTDKECGTPSGTSCRPAAAQGAARQSIRGGKIQARLAQTRSEYHSLEVDAAVW